jgi:hypothetical protein
VNEYANQIERTLASRSGLLTFLLTFACFRLVSPLSIRALELEAGVGIGRVPPSTSHSKSTVYIITVALKIKAFLHYVKNNFSRLFLTPFYSQPMRFAGTPAGTFWMIANHLK